MLATHFIRSYSQVPEVIILDVDDTHTNTHGQQQLTLFNNYYDEYCYMPLHIYEGLSGKLITTVLKPGRRSKQTDVSALMQRVIAFIRSHYWPKTRIILRGDSHFCSADFMQWASGQKRINFITGLSGNAVLMRLAETTIKSAERLYQQKKRFIKLYHSFSYQAGSWDKPHKVVTKVEMSSKGLNVRFIVTDLWEYRSQGLYVNIRIHPTHPVFIVDRNGFSFE